VEYEYRRRTRLPFVVRLLVNAAALWAATKLVDGVTFNGDWISLFGVALVFGVVNAFVRPIATVLTFPLIIVTFGIFLLILNGFMLILTSKLSAALGFGFHVSGFGAAFWGALVVSIVSTILSVMMRD
jgi:putative membrane protein